MTQAPSGPGTIKSDSRLLCRQILKSREKNKALTLAATAELALRLPVAGSVALATRVLAGTGLEVAGLEGVDASHGLTESGEGHGSRGDEEEEGEAHLDLETGLEWKAGKAEFDNRRRERHSSLCILTIKVVACFVGHGNFRSVYRFAQKSNVQPTQE